MTFILREVKKYEIKKRVLGTLWFFGHFLTLHTKANSVLRRHI